MPLASPDAMPAAFAAAWMARDASALARLFAADADFVNVVGIWWEDRTAIEAAHDYGLTTFFRDSRLTLGRTKTRMLGDAAAMVHARMILTGQIGPDGKTVGRRNSILSFVMARQGDHWLCVSAQNTDIVPGAETFTADGGTLTPRDYRTP